jgi:hypothetical protein
MEFIDYTNDPRAVLIHFNDKHDSNGRFAKKSGGISSSIKNRDKASFIGNKDLDIPVGEKKMAGMWARDGFKNATGYTPQDINRWLGIAESDENDFYKQGVKKLFINGMQHAVIDCTNFYLKESSAYKAYRTDEYRSEKDYLQGSARLYNSVYANMLDEFKESSIASAYLRSEAGQKHVAYTVGQTLKLAYNDQTYKDPDYILQRKARKKTHNMVVLPKEVKKRPRVTLADVKKANPDLPAAAQNEMFKGLTALAKKDSGIRGVSKLPENNIKHDDIYGKYLGETLLHFNPNHDPKTGQYTKNKSG